LPSLPRLSIQLTGSANISHTWIAAADTSALMWTAGWRNIRLERSEKRKEIVAATRQYIRS
jgi:hypothetical protein